MNKQSARSLQSPLGVETAGASSTVELSDVTGAFTLFHLRGQEIEAELRKAFNLVPEKPGDLSIDAGNILIRTRSDEIIIAVLQPSLNVLEGIRLTATDITHGRGVLRLRGPYAAQVLQKICGLDFSDTAFPTLHTAQSSLAKVHALIMRHDMDHMPVYTVVVDRSLAPYVWDALYDAMQEFIS